MENRKVIISQEEGPYSKISEALNALGDGDDPVEILLRPGIYRESFQIRRKNLYLRGDDPATTKIIDNNHAKRLLSDGSPMRTFQSATVFVLGDGFRAEGISFVNDAGDGAVVGQAVALAIDADRSVVRNCRLIGCQDTLFTGPLPPSPVEGSDFGGPSDVFPRKSSRQYYEDCFIEGDVDFIFGSATAIFRNCEIHSRDRGRKVNGYITAASTPEGSICGYLFDRCRLTGSAGSGTVFLGRPWRNYARTVFVDCQMEAHIHPEGWDDWEKPEARSSCCFAEYGSYGFGGDSSYRAAWSRILKERPETNPSVIFADDFWRITE